MLALVASGQVSSPSQVTVLFDASAASVAAFHFPDGATLETLAPPSAGISPVVIVLAVATFGLIFIGLVSVAGFTVMAQRRLRSLGMLSALGATDRNVHLVLVANGAVVGIVATLIGAVIGFLGWIAYVPHLQTSAGHRIDALNLPWWAIGTAMALAVVTAIAAARRPARSVARMPVVAALSGRPALPKAAHRSAVPGITLLVVGPCLLAFAGGWGGNSGKDTLLLHAAPTHRHRRHHPRWPPPRPPVHHGTDRRRPARADRDPARAARPRPLPRPFRGGPRGGHLRRPHRGADLHPRHCPVRRSRRLLRAQPPGEPAHRLCPGRQPARSWRRSSRPTPSERQRLRSRVSVIAASLDTNDVLELDAPMNPATGNTALLLQDMVSGGQPYVATPALLTHYGIKPNQIDPTADLLTSRAGLATVAGLQLIAPSGFGPGSFGCHPSD